MERYDYRAEICEDIRAYIAEAEIEITPENADDWKEALVDTLWAHDSVTGNGSGSYTFNAWRAEEYLCHNWDLMQEAMSEFGVTKLGGAEAMDVTIRCYLLGQCIDEVVEEMREEYDTEAKEAQP